jgi:hypothetical protein
MAFGAENLDVSNCVKRQPEMEKQVGLIGKGRHDSNEKGQISE